MPTIDWLKKEFSSGYDSGDILTFFPGKRRREEEKKIGGSYRKVFHKCLLPYLRPDSKVLELGPGRGSWTRAILKYIPQGELHAVDFQDVSKWLRPEQFNGRLSCHKVEDMSFSKFKNDHFDFFWSLGVLCHHNTEHISEILKNSLPKMKGNAIAVHHYANWDKLEKYGWDNGNLPTWLKKKADDEIWWPRNNKETMKEIAEEAGWIVEAADMDMFKRDGIIRLRKPL